MMMLTMIDGKICNAITSTQKCYICNTTPKEVNNFPAVAKKKDIDTVYPRSDLAYPRYMRGLNFLIYLTLVFSYRLEVKVW